ncbi:MAG TPA: mechanosensitive ion channel [Kiritimatiellia bacterium]|nr:mechanosensitive ion channel [Kiritimatiellia bacterium]
MKSLTGFGSILFCLLLGGAMAAWAQDGGSVSPVQTGKEVVQGAASAVTDVGQAVRTGGGDVVDQGRKLWQEAVLPMLQRTTAALPVLIKAIILLLGFWIVARLVGAGTTKVLGFTKLDERAARDWGLGDLLKRSDGSSCSIEQLVGGVVKWVILLVGFVAFFNALNLHMVAGPLQGIVDSIVKVVPSLLKAAVILFAYWAVASIARLALGKLLGVLKFDQRAGRFFPSREVDGKAVGPSELAGRLLFYVILLFGIPPFLQALGQEALVAPLQDMLSKTLAFIPNIIAAGIILLIGNIVAVIVREVVSSFLAAAGADQLADRLGVSAVFGKQKLSGLAAVIAYVFILVPIVISALDALQITAISLPVRNTLESVLAAIPAVLVASVIVFIGYAVARFVRGLVQNLLAGVGFDTLPARLGLDFLAPQSGRQPLSAIIGTVVMVVVLLLTASQALSSLGFDQLAALTDRFVRYLPNLFVGIIILLAALSLGRFVGNVVSQASGSSPYAGTLGTVARYAIVFLGAGMALDELGVSQQIVTVAVTAVLGGAALAIGLAFGLGGKDRAKAIIEKH